MLTPVTAKDGQECRQAARVTLETPLIRTFSLRTGGTCKHTHNSKGNHKYVTAWHKKKKTTAPSPELKLFTLLQLRCLQFVLIIPPWQTVTFKAQTSSILRRWEFTPARHIRAINPAQRAEPLSGLPDTVSKQWHSPSLKSSLFLLLLASLPTLVSNGITCWKCNYSENHCWRINKCSVMFLLPDGFVMIPALGRQSYTRSKVTLQHPRGSCMMHDLSLHLCS